MVRLIRHRGDARTVLGLALLSLALALTPPVALASTSNAGTVAVSPDGSLLYAGFNADQASVFSRDPSTGDLTVLGETPGAGQGGGEFSATMAVSPDGKNVYGVTGSGNTLIQYGITSTGVTVEETYAVLPDPSVAEDPVSVAVSPDGKSVYVTTYGYANGSAITSKGAITAYNRDPATGDLTDAGTTAADCCGGVSGIVSSPDSKFVYVADAGQVGGVGIFSRDPSTGALTKIGTTIGINGGVAIAISPDGDYVYVTGPPVDTSSAASTISILARDSTTGMLTPIGEVENGAAGVSSLSDMWGIAVSPDGDCVYATSRADNTITSFVRNPATGALSSEGALTEGTNGVIGLADARQVTVSPDGKNVYVASPGDSGVGVFATAASGCEITFVELAQDLFTLGQPTVNSTDGTGIVPVTVQAPGTVDLTTEESTVPPGARDAGSSTNVITVSRAGVVKAAIRLDSQQRAQLARTGRLSVREVVTFTARHGSPSTKSVVTELGEPTTAKIKAALSRVLIPFGRGGRRSVVLADRGYRAQFDGPGPGRLTIRWYARHASVVASASAKLTRAGRRKLTIRLTKTGRALLIGSKRLSLTARATFTLAGSKPVTASETFRLG